MKKIKICGIKNEEDVLIVNLTKPDICGFIVNYPSSFRSVNIPLLKKLSQQISSDIEKWGVFVQEDIESIQSLLENKVIDAAQLHGPYTRKDVLQLKPYGKIVQVFKPDFLEEAQYSAADLVLIDPSKGKGKSFDYTLVQNLSRDYFLSGGIDETTIESALQTHCIGVDVASGSETNRRKDYKKIKKLIETVKKEGQ